MIGLVIAGVAVVALLLFLKLNVSLSDEEIKEMKKIKAEEKAKKAKKETEKNKPVVMEEPKQPAKRVFRTDKATELLVQIMEDGSVKEIQQAMSNGINILQKLENNHNLLMIAVKNNPSTEVVHFLLDQGIEINDVDDNGQTALIMAAAFSPNPEVIKTLLDCGADKTIMDKSKKTAADYVVLNSSCFGTEVPALLKLKKTG
ncbi:MAG: ankyrin repeat domain-containing protein [Alphaproteobacteria bacterium]|nr:ankyrin repeat domain-containing protein [Alphaproteobacteria bacterium]